MKSTSLAVLSALSIVMLVGCIEEDKFDKYERPDWLAGKIFTQISDTAIFSTFAQALQISGYDTIINTSGSYTVFAPNDDAFDAWLAQNPAYSTIEDVPKEELTNLVKYHIVQNPWSRIQLMSLDVWGWIDPESEINDEPRGYKRETLLKNDNRKYGLTTYGDQESAIMIVDTMASPWYRRVITDSRKFAPIFFKDYFDIYDLSLDDYEFYFGRTFEDSKDLYFANARVIGDEIFAENGFIYNIDQVVEPLKNAYEIITSDYDGRSYSRFTDMVNHFPEFDYNERETFDQPGAEQGLQVDSLFEMTFPDLTFDITSEETDAPPGSLGLPGNVTIRYHHGMIAPTDAALEKLELEYMSGPGYWQGIENAPDNILRIITNTHLSVNPIYKTDLSMGFYTGEIDLLTLDESAIVQKQYGSNATFLGINDPLVPRAFSSITGPVYLREGFEKVMQGIEYSGLLPALKRERDPGQKYMFFVESDANTRQDSSFFFDEKDEEFFAFQISEGGGIPQRFNFTTKDLRTLLLNHVTSQEARGIARKEFVPNLAGNYLVFNNETGEVSGTAQTTNGYQGSAQVVVIPELLGDQDNGTTWEIDDWFSFTATSIYLRMSAYFPEFHDLIDQAGLANTLLNEYKFLSESEYYTVFAPTAQALEDFQVDTLSQEELQELIKLHFVKKELIFTDGNMPSGYYETTRESEESTQFTKVFTKIYVETGYDEISFPARSAGTYHTIIESDSTNILAGQSKSQGNVTIPDYVNTGVIHKIDKVLNINEIDVDEPVR